MGNAFQEEVDLHVLQVCLRQGRQQRWGNSTPTCGFGIEHVKEESYDVPNTSFHIYTSLSLLGSLYLYWESQLLVDYSKNLFTCKVLDGKVIDGGKRVADGVIYFHDQIYLTQDSKLKEGILHAAYEALFSMHEDSIESYLTIMERFYWEDLKEYVHQHIRRYVAHLMYEEESNHLSRLL